MREERSANSIGVVPARRLRNGALRALRLLEICPHLPVDAFRCLVGLRSWSTAYQQLARLKVAGLADARSGRLGYLLGERPVALWTITEGGKSTLRAYGVALTNAEHVALGSGKRSVCRGRRVEREADLPLLVASYRLLAWHLAEEATAGRMYVGAWERPWTRDVWSNRHGKMVHVKLPASARLCREDERESGTDPGRLPTDVVLLPDLGTAPVARYRQAIGGLMGLRRAQPGDCPSDGDVLLLVATPDADGQQTRRAAWLALLRRSAARQGQAPLTARVVGWRQVTEALAAGRPRRAAHRRAPVQGHERVLHLVGRHPFLTVHQMSGLLGTTTTRIRRLQRELVEMGWLQRVDYSPKLASGTNGPDRRDWETLGLVEVTLAGRRRIASWLGLDPPSASRHHGLLSRGRDQAGRRHRLLQALAHTIGANGVFVAFALAADAVGRQGGTDRLAEWRGAAACERLRCKPDGYGSYVRNGVAYGFFLEYDRGTESGRKYAAKFRSYYSYRDSRQAAHDYDGFPTLLFITTDTSAEERIADQAYRAWYLRGAEPLDVLITSIERIDHPQGILGPIWRTPGSTAHAGSLQRRYWLPGQLPRGFSPPPAAIELVGTLGGRGGRHVGRYQVTSTRERNAGAASSSSRHRRTWPRQRHGTVVAVGIWSEGWMIHGCRSQATAVFQRAVNE